MAAKSKKSKTDRWLGGFRKLTNRKGKTDDTSQLTAGPASVDHAVTASRTSSRPASPISSTVPPGSLNTPSSHTAQTTSPRQAASPTRPSSLHSIGNVTEMDTDGKVLRELSLSRLKPKHRERLRFLDHAGEVTEVLTEAVTETKRKRDEYKKAGSAIRSNDKVIKLSEKADSILMWLDRVKAVGDVASNADPIHIGLPWAGIRLLLIGFVAARQESTAFLVGVEAVSYIANQMKAYVDYFHSLPLSSLAKLSFQGSLVDMYSTLFKFVAKALNRYETSRTTNAWKAFWSERNVDKFEEDCEKNSVMIERAAAQCAREQDSKQYESLKRELECLKGTRDSLKRLETKVEKIWLGLEKDKEAAVLRWISPIMHEDLHYIAHDGITEGTGDWILQDPTFVNWDNGLGPKMLWLSGKVGTGKTKLTAHSVEILKEKTTNNVGLGHDNALAYFYFRKDDPQRGRPLHALSSFLKQLVVHSGQIHTTVVQEYEKRRETGHLKFEEVLMHLCTVIQSYSEVYLIVDAFDECEETEQLNLKDVLSRIVTSCPQCKIFISGRPYENIKALLKDCAAVILDRSRNQGDIDTFIKDELAKHEKQRENIGLPSISPETESLIVKKLTWGSDGMFQWVKLHLAQLMYLDLDSDIKTALDDLPPGLEKTYDQIWERLKRAPGRSFERAQRAIQWIFHCFSEPTEDILLAAICQDIRSTPQESTLQFENVLRSCPGLIHKDPNGEVAFTHLSVKEYFRKFHLDLLHDGAMWIASMSLRLLSHQTTWDYPRDWHYFPPKESNGLEQLAIYSRVYWPDRCQEADKIGERTAGAMELVNEFRELQSRFLGLEMDSCPSDAYLNWSKDRFGEMKIVEEDFVRDMESLINLEELLQTEHWGSDRHLGEAHYLYCQAIIALFLQDKIPHLLQHSAIMKNLYVNTESGPGRDDYCFITRDLHEPGAIYHDKQKRAKDDVIDHNRALELLGVVLSELYLGHSIDIKEHPGTAAIISEFESQYVGTAGLEVRTMIQWCLTSSKLRANTWRRDFYYVVRRTVFID